MAIIGNPIVSTDFPKDTFSGNGSTTAFTMSIAPASVNAVIVVVSGITQDPSTYTISGTTLTFSAAPPTGTSNISVRHLGVAGTPQVPATGSVVPSSINSGYSLWNLSGADVTYTAGLVGIGGTPVKALSVIPTSIRRMDFYVRDPGTDDALVIRSQHATNNNIRDMILEGSFLRFYTGADSGGSGSERMRVDSSGNVGIGGTSLGGKLEVVQGTSGSNFRHGSGTYLNISTGAANGTVDIKADATSGAYPALTFHAGGVEQGRFGDTGLFRFNSGYGSVATAYGCRAWVNFNGTGTVAIRASGNVSSITDSGTGAYIVNFTTAFPDANYAVCGTAGGSANEYQLNKRPGSPASTTSVGIIVGNPATSDNDDSNINVAVFR